MSEEATEPVTLSAAAYNRLLGDAIKDRRARTKADAALARKDAMLRDIHAELESGVMFQQKRNGEATGRATEIVRALAARIEAELEARP